MISLCKYIRRAKGVTCLDLPADTCAYISSVHNSGEDQVEQEIQDPGDRIANHDGAELRLKGINKLHPDHTKTEIEYNVRDAGQHGVPKGL
jgi:hypothetical protein